MAGCRERKKTLCQAFGNLARMFRWVMGRTGRVPSMAEATVAMPMTLRSAKRSGSGSNSVGRGGVRNSCRAKEVREGRLL